jgi:hypothetical protein
MKKYLPSLVCGFAASVVTVIPGVKNFGCCLFLPVAALFSVILYKRTNNTAEQLRANSGLVLGFFTGIFAAVFATAFDLLLTYIFHSNEFVATFPQSEAMMRDIKLGPLIDETLGLLKQMINEIKKTGFSPIYSAGIFISNIITFSVFGIIGGLLGVLFVNRKGAAD